MRILLSDYQGSEAREFNLERDDPPTLISMTGSYWAWTDTIYKEGEDELEVYERVVPLEMDPF